MKSGTPSLKNSARLTSSSSDHVTGHQRNRRSFHSTRSQRRPWIAFWLLRQFRLLRWRRAPQRVLLRIISRMLTVSTVLRTLMTPRTTKPLVQTKRPLPPPIRRQRNSPRRPSARRSTTTGRKTNSSTTSSCWRRRTPRSRRSSAKRRSTLQSMKSRPACWQSSATASSGCPTSSGATRRGKGDYFGERERVSEVTVFVWWVLGGRSILQLLVEWCWWNSYYF